MESNDAILIAEKVNRRIIKEEKQGTNYEIGNFGKVTTADYLVWNASPGFLQKITRISKLSRRVFECEILSMLDNLIERLSVELLINEELGYRESINLIKYHSRYFYSIYSGFYVENCMFPIPFETYAKMRATVIEMCDPNREIRMDELIDLLRESGNPDIDVNSIYNRLREKKSSFGK